MCNVLFVLCNLQYLSFIHMLQHKEDSRDLAHKIAKEFDAEYWETSSKTGTI